MCVAIIATKKFPSEEVLHKCESSNGDGGGIAWVENKIVRWKKNLKAHEIAKMIRDKEVSLPSLIHFRIATVGGKTPKLCHPFPITKNASTELEGSAKKVLIHNGHWNDWQSRMTFSVIRQNRIPSGEWSDSRAMAYLAGNYGDRILNFISYQKIATLDGNGKALYYGGSWDEEDTVLYSNKSWSYKYSSGSSSLGSYPRGPFSSIEAEDYYRDWEDYERRYDNDKKDNVKTYTTGRNSDGEPYIISRGPDGHGTVEWQKPGGGWAKATFQEYRALMAEKRREREWLKEQMSLDAPIEDIPVIGKGRDEQQKAFLPTLEAVVKRSLSEPTTLRGAADTEGEQVD